jgi:hypothetical protein
VHLLQRKRPLAYMVVAPAGASGAHWQDAGLLVLVVQTTLDEFTLLWNAAGHLYTRDYRHHREIWTSSAWDDARLVSEMKFRAQVCRSSVFGIR